MRSMILKRNLAPICFSLLLAITATGCQVSAQQSDGSQTSTEVSTSTLTETNSEETFFNTEQVHTIDLEVDETVLAEMIAAYQEDGSKNWIEATVTIDGETFQNVGLKLKGNSTLKSAIQQSTDSLNAEELPWVIRLDKYVDDQAYLGRTRFVIRKNNTESSMNEALALAMLEEAGVATQASAFTRFTVNGSAEKLTLVVDVPDDDLWTEEQFGANGLLYKAEAGGDYSYRGTEATDYADAFEQKYGDDDLTPLITFLDFINNSTDEEFAENLSNYLDVEAFAAYLVMQDLVGNDDDIDGPGNNSYLYYDFDTQKMTVVAWDQNLSFGGFGGQGGGMKGNRPFGDEEGNERPELPVGEDGEVVLPDGQTMDDFTFPEGQEPGMMTPPEGAFEDGQEMPTIPEGELPNFEANGGRGGMMGANNNILVTRFLKNETFSQLVETKKTEATATVIESQFAATTLAHFQDLLRSEAADLIDEETITSEGEAITQFLTGINTVNPSGDKQEEAKTGDTTDVDTPESTTP